jgi:putative hydrolase of HD superfamily
MLMDKKALDRITGFMVEVAKVKGINRTGWVLSGVKHPEHVGDHMFSTAVLSYLLAKNAGLDADKCLKMALLHDIHEAITGDIPSRNGVSSKRKDRLEVRDTTRVLSRLGSSGGELRSLLREFIRCRTVEARFVHEVDKLDYVVQLMQYSSRMKPAMVREFLSSGGNGIHAPELRHIYDKVRKHVYRELHWKQMKPWQTMSAEEDAGMGRSERGQTAIMHTKVR